MKRTKLGVLGLGIILSLCSSVSWASHPCVQGDDLAEISRCLEALPMRLRLEGFRDAVPDVLPMLTGDRYEFGVRLFDPDKKMTRLDAVRLYRRTRRIFREALADAQREDKQLVFVGGESHVDRTALMMGQMLLKIGRREGAVRFGWETARESFMTPAPDAVHYRGLLEQVSLAYDSLQAPGTPLPSEK